ncbi:hypothetical protein K8352_04065 [Flavobacteriaceae bacterium F89]|uniref:Alpha/beta hydrolase n=1 Tax=Cerina litoralis TaxID=2874477 RepID=A0AAE3EUA9_9FLAO|nr:hypothetical protein [Cerina litoralis]MCG2459911.1 hypothetical protein [Cerina litoralis]
MAERLVVLSDMWGLKKGLWITSYLGYLQQYYHITYYDSQQLASINPLIESEENVHAEFTQGGIDTAVAHLLTKETKPCHYLAFSTGGSIAWKAALRGLPIKSLTVVSSTRLRLETEKPSCPITLLYGENDRNSPPKEWSLKLGVKVEVLPHFGHDMYTDEKVISKVSRELLNKVMTKQLHA